MSNDSNRRRHRCSTNVRDDSDSSFVGVDDDADDADASSSCVVFSVLILDRDDSPQRCCSASSSARRWTRRERPECNSTSFVSLGPLRSYADRLPVRISSDVPCGESEAIYRYTNVESSRAFCVSVASDNCN